MALWCRITFFDGSGAAGRSERVTGAGSPDLATVDRIAGRALEAKRAGGRLVLSEVGPEMRDLLRLVALPFELEGQPEGREQALGVEEVEEEGHLGDPSA
jgi:hypothetical protein